MKALLDFQYCWDIVEEGYAELENTVVEVTLTNKENRAIKKVRKKDKRELTEQPLKKFQMRRHQRKHGEFCKNPFNESKGKKVRLQAFRVEFETSKMKVSKCTDDYVTRVKAVVNEMKRNGKTPNDVRVMEKNLHSLTHKIEYVLIGDSKGLSQISIDELVGSLQAHEHKMKQNDDTRNLEQVLQSKLSFNKS
ncbi:polyprotein [Gossypium australe]|uniref:Polyprotein n=1 Tax=Gossypium australe TaxID=47621 RepID=A0A5B6WH89_9ROSI|nr:polyprotein [Gossypium australe]